MIYCIKLKTDSKTEFIDITGRIKEAVKTDGLQSGICQIFVLHTTAAVTINENADPDVVADIISQLDSLIPQLSRYRHSKGNSPAHIKASLIGASETRIVEKGDLQLGTWQGVFFCEFDGPRERIVLVKTISD